MKASAIYVTMTLAQYILTLRTTLQLLNHTQQCTVSHTLYIKMPRIYIRITQSNQCTFNMGLVQTLDLSDIKLMFKSTVQ